MDAVSENARNIVAEELEALKQRIIARHRQAGQVASGKTIASLRVEKTADGGTLYGRPAFGTLETGRKPGRVPQNFEAVIKQWILDKGISVTPIPYIRQPSARWTPKYTPEERGLNTLAGAIAYKIRTEGTTLYRHGGRSDIYSPEIPLTVESLRKRMLGLFKTEVEHININSNENI